MKSSRNKFIMSRTSLEEEKTAKFVRELVASTPNQRNWKGILIALLVIGFVCALIILSVILLTPDEIGPRVSGTRFSLEDLLGETFKPPTFRSQWVSNNEVTFRDNQGGISLLNVDTLETKRYVQEFTYRRLAVKEFWISSKKKYILFLHDTGKENLRNSLRSYTVMEMASEQLEPVTPFPSPLRKPELLQFVQWVPNSEALLMIHDNDIYFRKSPVASEVVRLTDTGKKDEIFNGITDHLYREYILHKTEALWVSQDHTYLCYASFNDSGVKTVNIPLYMSQYSTMKTIRYPKVDTANPVVTLWVIKLENVTSPEEIERKDIKPPNRVKDEDHYFTDAKWVDEESISVVWRNRHQNISVATLCTSPLWFCKEVITDTSERRNWVITRDVPIFGLNTTEFVTILPLSDGTHGTFLHVHQGKVYNHHYTPLTYGPYTVFSVLAWDTDQNYVYYVANTDSDPAERHLWRVTDISSEEPRIQECLTCGLNYSSLSCRHFVPSFAPDNFDKILLHCEGPLVPNTVLYSLSEEQIVHRVQFYPAIQVLSDQMAWPQQKDFKLDIEDDFVAKIRMLLPPEMIENEGIPHPTIFLVSGIPGHQVVNYKWGADFGTYLASNKSWIVILMDVRGSGGEELKKEYQPAWNLGHYEALDHLSIAKYLSETAKNDLVDNKRIGVLGIGHGGYNALRMLSYDKLGIITCTAAINPITDWMDYASYYSEKFMGTARVIPGGNFRGYEDSSLLRRGIDFLNKSLYLIHGSGDTNVLPSHSLKFSKELIKEGVLFRQQAYADENHLLEDSLEHVYRSLEEYFANCFPPFEEEEEAKSILGI